jgi:Ca2+:H+ antiporter
MFFVAALGIVPIAGLISGSTERLAVYTGETVGGLLNAMFGNLPELIIGVAALKAGLYAVVAASIVGAILFNLLLVLGLSFLVSGVRQHSPDFNPRAVSVYGSMMFIAVMSLALPSIYQRAFAAQAVVAEHESLNSWISILLLLLYGLYLVFMLRTHTEVFASVQVHEGEHEHEGARWSLTRCLVTLAISSVFAAILSEILVGAVEGTGKALGLSTPFLGIVLLASIGGAAEGVSAVTAARRGRLDLSLGIALGSCTLIALFVAPLLVFSSYLVAEKPFFLSFSPTGLGLMFLSVLIAAFVSSGGSGNWYKGVQLITVYLMIALLLYFVPT